MKITNNHSISLPLAVWLLHDNYDYNRDANYISATGLLKSIKQIVLSSRVSSADKELDLSDLIAARFGHALHDSVEQAWRASAPQQMKRLGISESIAKSIVINPTEADYAANPDLIPVWFEHRSIRTIGGYQVGGKFDQVIQGRLFDFKSTSVWTYIYKSKDEDYKLQLSIYRWLNPELITDDYGFIQFIFTDWQRKEAKRDPVKYPQTRILEYPIELMSLRETENWIARKIDVLSRSWQLPEEQLPPCNDKELWRSETKYKYFANAAKTDGRATKNFNSMAEAHNFMASQGGKGTVLAFPGEVKACEYCPAFSICKQKDQYFD